ncbi:hypothetical protein EV424DRAFT_1350516 [Suillus variegatus]|nr:hypothetical protein EV424DRAFT_1350516 [Suillus variegatus]
MDGVCVLCTLSITDIAWKDVAPVSPHEDIVCFFDSYGCGYLDAPRVTYDTTLYITQLVLFVQHVKWENTFVVGLSMANLSSVIKRPFHSVADPLYIEEVKLSHPDVHVPSPRSITLICCETVRFIAKIAYLSTFQQTSRTSFEFFRSLDLWRVSIDEAYVESRNNVRLGTRFYPAKFPPPMKWWLLKILCAKFVVCVANDASLWFISLCRTTNNWAIGQHLFAADTKVLKVSLFPIDVAQRQDQPDVLTVATIKRSPTLHIKNGSERMTTDCAEVYYALTLGSDRYKLSTLHEDIDHDEALLAEVGMVLAEQLSRHSTNHL